MRASSAQYQRSRSNSLLLASQQVYCSVYVSGRLSITPLSWSCWRLPFWGVIYEALSLGLNRLSLIYSMTFRRSSSIKSKYENEVYVLRAVYAPTTFLPDATSSLRERRYTAMPNKFSRSLRHDRPPSMHNHLWHLKLCGQGRATGVDECASHNTSVSLDAVIVQTHGWRERKEHEPPQRCMKHLLCAEAV